jgi:outer membrane lipoprotein-sorting protein
MRNRHFRFYWLGAVPLLFWTFAALCQPVPQGYESPSNLKSVVNAPLPVEQVVKRLEEKNAERTAALKQYEATRIYRMQYRGFPSDRDAEMVIHMAFRSPNSKEFRVVSQTGSKLIIDRVFRKLLEGELEAADEENRQRTALTTENYDFALAGYEPAPEGGRYILNLTPRTKNKFLYRGKIWVDAKDFAVVRIKGEPGKNPSFWIKKIDVEHSYEKVGDFWLPAQNRTESVVRLGGVAHLSIEYKDYKILKAEPLRDAKAGSKR